MKKFILFLIVLVNICFVNAQVCKITESFKNDLLELGEDYRDFVRLNEKGQDAWHVFYLLSDVPNRKDLNSIKNINAHLSQTNKTSEVLAQEIRKAGGYTNWVDEVAKAGVKLNFTKIADFGGDIIYIEGRKLNILGKVAPSNGSLGTTELLLQAPSNIKPNIKVLSTGMTPAQKNMKVLDGMNDYWSKTNEGFIDDIIANSGDIRFIHDPRVFENGWIKVSDLPTNTPKQIAFKNKCVSENLIKFRSFLGREYDYLLSKGYVLQESGLIIKP